MWYVIIGLIIGLAINAIGATLMKKAAILKGYGDDSHIWAICFWLGIIGDLYVIALPDLILQGQNHRLITEKTGG